MWKRISQASASSISITNIDSTASIVIVPPMQGTLSSIPLSGKFIITCTDSAGVPWDSRPFKYNHWTEGIQLDLGWDIPFLADRVKVLPLNNYRYRENGVHFLIDFFGLKYDVPLCSMKDDTTDPLVGNSRTYSVTKTRPYGQNIMFEPLPLEFLKTTATSPQVIVSVAGL